MSITRRAGASHDDRDGPAYYGREEEGESASLVGEDSTRVAVPGGAGAGGSRRQEEWMRRQPRHMRRGASEGSPFTLTLLMMGIVFVCVAVVLILWRSSFLDRLVLIPLPLGEVGAAKGTGGRGGARAPAGSGGEPWLVDFHGESCQVHKFNASALVPAVDRHRASAQRLSEEDVWWQFLRHRAKGSILTKGDKAAYFAEGPEVLRARFELVEEAMKKPVNGSTALVLACGVGRAAFSLASSLGFSSVLCVDHTPETLQVAFRELQRHPAAVAAAVQPILARPWFLDRVPPRSYDLVLFDNDVLARLVRLSNPEEHEPGLLSVMYVEQVCDLLATSAPGALAIGEIAVGLVGGVPIPDSQGAAARFIEEARRRPAVATESLPLVEDPLGDGSYPECFVDADSFGGAGPQQDAWFPLRVKELENHLALRGCELLDSRMVPGAHAISATGLERRQVIFARRR